MASLDALRRFVGFVAAVSIVAGFAPAQEPATFPAQIHAVGNNPVAVVAGDLDNNGMTDVVTANRDGDSISVLLGNGAGEFAPAVDFSIGTAPSCVALGDLDNDGHLDVIVGHGVPLGMPGFVSVRLGAEGPTGFTLDPVVSTFCGFGPKALAIADLNGDGKLDVAVGNGTSLDIGILYGDGAGNLALPVSLLVGAPVNSLVLADFTGDGLCDIAAATDSTAIPLSLWTWTQGGYVLLPSPQVPSPDAPRFLAFADVNDDGKGDLVVGCGGISSSTPGLVVALGGNGAGAFNGFAIPTLVAGSLTGMSLYDVNGDGGPDLLTTHDATATMSARFGAGGGAFAAARDYLVGDPMSGAKGLAVAKLNNRPDVNGFFPTSNGHMAIVPSTVSWSEHAITTVFATEAGTFGTQIPYVSPGSYYMTTAIGDLDSDGIADVAATDTQNWRVDVLKGDGAGNLSFKSARSVFLGNLLSTVALGDMNGDGDLDAVVGSFAMDIGVALGTGAGTLGAFTTYSSGSLEALLGDLDLDGNLDVVAAGFSLEYRLGLGNGLLGSPQSWSSGPGGSQAALGDLNEDGLLDIAVPHSNGPPAVSVGFGQVLMGTYAGFSAPIVALSGAGGAGVGIADLNGDNHLDIAALGTSIRTAHGDGAGNFSNGSAFGLSYEAYVLRSGDFNRDGFSDLVMFGTDSSFGKGSALTRFGSINGLSPKSASWGLTPKNFLTGGGWVTVGDLDGNGADDIVLTGESISVLLNQTPASPYAPWYGVKATTLGCQGLQSLNALGDVKVGSSNFQLHCSNAPANSLGLALVTTSAIPTGADTFSLGLNLLVDLIGGSPITFDVFSNAKGEGYAAIPIPNNPQLVGYTAYAQTLWYWPGACNPSLLNLSSSSGVALSIHP